ncbi:MAG: helix-turn-helix domain-containing protein [Microbacteriaceae bacterium]
MAESHPRSTLGRLLDDLGLTLVDVALGRVDPSREVSAVVIHDPLDPPLWRPGDLALGVGLGAADEIAEVVRDLDAIGGVAVVLRSPVPVDAQLRRAVEESGVVLLELTHGASWSQAASMLTASLGLADTQLAAAIESDDRGDLFALANAVADLLHAPVTVEDLNSQVLAFSADQGEADDYRKNAVLGRRVPDDITDALRSTGLFNRIYAAHGAVLFSPADSGMDPALLPRAVIAIRAGDEVLGTIWAVLRDGELTAERAAALEEATRPAAMQLLRARMSARGQDRARTVLVNTLIQGGAAARDAASRTGRFTGRSCVLAVGPVLSNDAVHSASELQRLASSFTLHMATMHPQAVAATIGATVYGVIPVGRSDRTAVIDSADEFVRRVSRRTPVVVGIGAAVEDPTALATSREDADRALRVLRSGAPRPGVAHIDDVQVQWLLLQLGDLIAAERRDVTGPIARLLAYDAGAGGELLATLRAWLDAFGDVATASQRLFVHANTLRYRLRRIAEIAEVDLDDPEVRFGMMLQLRVFG